MIERVKRLRGRLLGRRTVADWQRLGAVIGARVHLGPGVNLDYSHAWLVTIGDDTTLAPDVHVLTHDASLKRRLGYARIGRVTIGSRVFIGARAIIMPGVSIGDDAVVGAGSLVTSDVPAGVLVIGSPAREVKKVDELAAGWQAEMERRPVWDASWTLDGGIDSERKRQQREALSDGPGFVV